ncbi:MAG TPA: PAS domain S-box protein [Pyrinomonadaceae bacterium]
MTHQTVERGTGEGGRSAAERFAYATLDALAEHVAVVDARGNLLAVNQAWRDFAAANSPAPAALCEGANYLAACAGAAGEGAEYAARFDAGLRAVLAGESGEFALEYPCHTPSGRCWFIARIKRFEYEGESRAVVTHANVTARREAEEERERLLLSLESEKSRLAYLFEHAPSFVAVLRGPAHVFEFANQLYVELIGGRDVLGKPVREALPEIEGQGYFELLDEVFRAGRPHSGRGVRVLVRRESGQDEERFLDFVYQPMLDADGAVYGVFVHGVDVTEHKRAEDRARASEERYRTLFNSIDEGFCVTEVLFDAEGRGVDHRHLEVNLSFAKLTGIPVEDVLSGRTVGELVPNIEAHWSETFGRVLTTGEPERFAYGSEALRRWFDVYAFRVGSPEERKVGILFNNITDRKLAEEALRRSESNYRLLMEQASDGIHTYDTRGNIIEANSKLCEMLGYTHGELLRLNVADLIPDEDLADAPIRFDRLAAGETVLTERRLRRKDGALLPVEISGRMVSGGVLQAIVRDVSERKRAEEALREAYGELERRVEERTAELGHAIESLMAGNAERLRAEEARRELLGRLVVAQEEERRRISRELHDQMGQQLAALMIGLKTLNSDSYGRQSALATLRQLQGLTDQLSREVHTLAWGLRPPALDDLGLCTALFNHLEEWAERSRVAVDFHSSGFEGGRLPFSYETALYRIVQEALTNVLKHSGADRVSVIIERRADHVLAVVEDNGRGFDAEALAESPARGHRLGLLGMRERAELLGGTLNVESTPGVGTSVFVRIPVGAAVEGGEDWRG